MFADTVSVEGNPSDSLIVPRHYGSGYTMADYKTESHNIYATATFIPAPALNLFATVTYTMSTGSYEEVLFPISSIEERLINDTHPSGDLEHQDFDFAAMTSYSDLDYDWLRLALGAEYRIGNGVTLTADGEYHDVTDNAGGYVYGDETGSMFIIRSGVRLTF